MDSDLGEVKVIKLSTDEDLELGGGGEEEVNARRNAVLFQYDAMPDFWRFFLCWKVIAYTKECMQTFWPGIQSVILQLKCPVQQKNHNDDYIYLALGRKCPEELRSEICMVWCADQLCGFKNLSKFSIFNCHVDCCVNPTSCHCAVCTLWKPAFLERYTKLCASVLMQSVLRWCTSAWQEEVLASRSNWPTLTYRTSTMMTKSTFQMAITFRFLVTTVTRWGLLSNRYVLFW